MSERIREEIAAACRRLAGERLVVGTGGNVSARDGEQILVTPSGATLADVNGSDLVAVAPDGSVSGDGRPTSELALHRLLYERNPGAGAVVHTHAPMATALSCILDELPAIHYTIAALGGPVPVAPYATFGSDELAARVVDAIEGHTAALMQNHGALTWGPDLSSALDNALLLEWLCGVYWHARALAQPATLTSEQLQDVVATAVDRGYGQDGG